MKSENSTGEQREGAAKKGQTSEQRLPPEDTLVSKPLTRCSAQTSLRTQKCHTKSQPHSAPAEKARVTVSGEWSSRSSPSALRKCRAVQSRREVVLWFRTAPNTLLWSNSGSLPMYPKQLKTHVYMEIHTDAHSRIIHSCSKLGGTK